MLEGLPLGRSSQDSGLRAARERIHWSVPLQIGVQGDGLIWLPVKVAHLAFMFLVGLPSLGPWRAEEICLVWLKGIF